MGLQLKFEQLDNIMKCFFLRNCLLQIMIQFCTVPNYLTLVHLYSIIIQLITMCLTPFQCVLNIIVYLLCYNMPHSFSEKKFCTLLLHLEPKHENLIYTGLKTAYINYKTTQHKTIILMV